jgi:hypothetical protein
MMMMTMMMNAFVGSYHPDLHAGSSSHSQEPPSQTNQEYNFVKK